MKKNVLARSGYRWLAGLVVVAVVLVIVVFKVAGAPKAASIASSAPGVAAEVSASPVAMPLSTLSEDAPTLTAAPSDPLPLHPQDQVDWVMRNKKPAMILFHSTNCIPCKAMDKLVKKVRADYEPGIVFIDVITNNNYNTALIRSAQIQAIPTTFLLRRSGEGKRVVGAMNEEALRAELAGLLAGD